MRTHVLNNHIPNLKQGEDRTNTIEILAPADMRSYSLFLFFALPDGSKTFTPKLTMTDNKVSYVIPAGITAKTGRVTVELQGYLDNRLIKSVSYAFFVVAAVSTPTDPPFEDFVPWYLEVMQKADQVETDKSAVTAMKNQIKTEETQRQVDEIQRNLDENTRKTNEIARAETFGQWADTQADWAADESTRDSAETSRGTAEGLRATAETGRVNAESSRVTAENNRQATIDAKVPKTTTVNGKALSANISLTATDVPNTPAGGIVATTVQEAVNELDTEKANKAQEEWITPSLVNGATHSGRPLQYRLNDIGQLEFRGELSSAPSVLATTIFSVRGKYLPKTNNGGVVSRNNAFARVQLSQAGNFNQTAGATTGALNVDGLTINVG